MPGLRSSRITILDTKDDPRSPTVVKVLEAAELAKRAGYYTQSTVDLRALRVVQSGVRAGRSAVPGGKAAVRAAVHAWSAGG